MVSTKALRDIIEEATKRASDVIGDAKVPEVSIGRTNEDRMLVFGMGLMLGAIIGMVLAFLMAPRSGERARQRLNEQVDKVRRQREEIGTNGATTYGATAPGSSAGTFERG